MRLTMYCLDLSRFCKFLLQTVVYWAEVDNVAWSEGFCLGNRLVLVVCVIFLGLTRNDVRGML